VGLTFALKLLLVLAMNANPTEIIEENYDVAPQPPSSSEVSHKPVSTKIKRKRWLWLFAVAVLAVLVYAVARWQTNSSAASKRETTAPPPVPVAIATANKGAMPVYLNGLGTVTPTNQSRSAAE
jgi:hypothetical protein